LEPGIPSSIDVAKGLRKVLDTGLIDPEAILIRYDPLLKVRAPNGRVIRNDTAQAFEPVARLFSALGVKNVETKFLLLGQREKDKYHHVWERMNALDIQPLPLSDFPAVFGRLSVIASNCGMALFSCCIKHFIPTWTSDSGCLSAERLTRVGKRRFGDAWACLSYGCRPSRPGCGCSRYFDLSNVKGHKKCGSQDAACLYCTASCERFGAEIKDKAKREIQAFSNGEREEQYRYLLCSDEEI
jgi:hypothetical protein